MVGVLLRGVIWFIIGLFGSAFALMSIVPDFETVIPVMVRVPIVIASGLFLAFIMYRLRNAKSTKEETERALEERKRALKELQELRKRALDGMKVCNQELIQVDSELKHMYKISRLLIDNANKHLDKAEMEFQDGLYSPFWDEIEKVTNHLAEFHQTVESIGNTFSSYEITFNRNSKEYDTYITETNAAIDKFLSDKNPSKFKDAGIDKISTEREPSKEITLSEKLPDVSLLVTRLQALVREAQKDFQFSTIFEQRKTNKLLIHGFGTLESSLSTMGDTINSSINKLSSTLGKSLNDILVATESQSKILNEQNSILRESSKEQRKFEKKALNTLDNIQRGEKPLF